MEVINVLLESFTGAKSFRGEFTDLTKSTFSRKYFSVGHVPSVIISPKSILKPEKEEFNFFIDRWSSYYQNVMERNDIGKVADGEDDDDEEEEEEEEEEEGMVLKRRAISICTPDSSTTTTCILADADIGDLSDIGMVNSSLKVCHSSIILCHALLSSGIILILLLYYHSS